MLLSRTLRLISLCAALAGSLAAATYHVDCNSSRDSGDGLSPSSPWKTLDEVNRRTFVPGDSILFRRGASCAGALSPKGSGASGRPIKLGAYGTGALPKIEAGSKHATALKLFNQEYWEISSLDISGGTEFGIHVSGNVKEAVLHHIHVRDVVVHDVFGGDLKAKESGLIVITPGAAEQRFDDVLVDGATAYNTNQWSGIMVGGAAFGIPHDRYRSTNIVVRNSTVHDVYGDGIVVFFAHRAVIERSVAWNTGFQPGYTIGTPNAIWTWMCRDCVVQFNEAYLSDSPGFDGGAFDIDWADDDNIVQYNYAHDTQGYCIAVFGAGYTTRNSIVRYNVCANNGLSPRLARFQGAVFLHTWNDGNLDGLEVYNNTIVWNPTVKAPAVVSDAAFTGSGPRFFKNNLILSASPSLLSIRGGLQLDHNLYGKSGGGPAEWTYGGKTYETFGAYQEGSGQERSSVNKDPRLVSPEYHGIGLDNRAFRLAPGSPAIDAGAGLPNMGAHDVFGTAIPQGKGYDIGASEFGGGSGAAAWPPVSSSLQRSLDNFRGKWLLVGYAAADAADSRSLLVQLRNIERQFRGRNLQVAVAVDAGSAGIADFRADRQLGDIPLIVDSEADPGSSRPVTLLISPEMRVAARWDGFGAPARMGVALRSILGERP